MIWTPGQVWGPELLAPATIQAIKDALLPAQVMGLTAWAEARSRYVPGKGWVENPLDAQADIVNIVMNRAADPRWQARGPKGVCLQRWQFSCWEPAGGPDDPKDADTLAENFEALLERAQRLLKGDHSDKVGNCVALAEGALAGQLLDSLQNACHYFADWLAPPAWAHPPAVETVARYGHRFWAHVK